MSYNIVESWQRDTAMSRPQLNLRISEKLEKLIDQKRIELSHKLGEIPTRSEVMRFALEAYLGVDLSESESDGRSNAAKTKK